MPAHGLPSLDLLRGFVAVGRRMSITLAARDLFLTQSAVSRQIHALEEQLGLPLFTRGYRSIAFTPEGERLFRSADAALRQLQEAVADLASHRRARPVTVSTTIGFTALWLMPRLGRFQREHPDVDVRVSAHNPVMDLRGSGIDLAIRYASARHVPPGSPRLFDEVVVPVASPSLGVDALRSPRALSGLTLLEFEERYPWLQWGHWLESRGWQSARPRGTLQFNQYDLVIQAALAGQGVALGRRELIRPMLDDGRLVALAPPRRGETQGYAYWLVRAPGTARPEVERVADWIMREAAQQAGKSAPRRR